MALDSALKRGSAIHPGSPWRAFLPFPDGSVDDGDRAASLLLYSGIVSVAGSAPTLLGQIPNLSAPYDSGTHQYDLSQYFASADTYAIDPAVETGWSFDTNTGLLEIDTDVEDTFGPYTVTASNGDGDTDSNAFLVLVAVPTPFTAVSGMLGFGRMMQS